MRAWVLTSAAVAPVALIGGWTVAASRQPPGYDPVRDTISALAARGATDRWIMTLALAVVGASYLLTAAGLTEVGRTARGLVALGGLATLAVAALPQPHAGHVPAAVLAFVVLAVWPATSRAPTRWLGVLLAAVLIGLLIWLGVQSGGGSELGLAERFVAGAEAFGPLVVAAACGRAKAGEPRWSRRGQHQ